MHTFSVLRWKIFSFLLNWTVVLFLQISTVDAFQGGEKDLIVLSCVRTDHVGFIDCDRCVIATDYYISIELLQLLERINKIKIVSFFTY